MERYFLFHSGDKGGLHVLIFDTKEKLLSYIKECNDESIRIDCRPIYLPGTEKNFSRVRHGDTEAIIIKGFTVLPKAVKVVEEYELE
jgi:hypothetical protein